jgi:hypothetical protein
VRALIRPDDVLPDGSLLPVAGDRTPALEPRTTDIINTTAHSWPVLLVARFRRGKRGGARFPQARNCAPFPATGAETTSIHGSLHAAVRRGSPSSVCVTNRAVGRLPPLFLGPCARDLA